MPVYTIPVTTVGANGAATGSETTDFDFPTAFLDAIAVEFGATAPATTTVVVAESEGLGRTLLSLAAGNTDKTYYPRHLLHKEDGTDDTVRDMFVIQGPISITVDDCNALSPAVTVKVSVLISGQIR